MSNVLKNCGSKFNLRGKDSEICWKLLTIRQNGNQVSKKSLRNNELIYGIKIPVTCNLTGELHDR